MLNNLYQVFLYYTWPVLHITMCLHGIYFHNFMIAFLDKRIMDIDCCIASTTEANKDRFSIPFKCFPFKPANILQKIKKHFCFHNLLHLPTHAMETCRRNVDVFPHMLRSVFIAVLRKITFYKPGLFYRSFLCSRVYRLEST